MRLFIASAVFSKRVLQSASQTAWACFYIPHPPGAPCIPNPPSFQSWTNQTHIAYKSLHRESFLFHALAAASLLPVRPFLNAILPTCSLNIPIATVESTTINLSFVTWLFNNVIRSINTLTMVFSIAFLATAFSVYLRTATLHSWADSPSTKHCVNFSIFHIYSSLLLRLRKLKQFLNTSSLFRNAGRVYPGFLVI